MFPTGPSWYQRLAKPAWTPPNWVFPVAWSTLYLLMSFAGARVVANIADDPRAGAIALVFWAIQIAANTLWTPIFFGLRRIRAALPVMAILWLAVLVVPDQPLAGGRLGGPRLCPLSGLGHGRCGAEPVGRAPNPDVTPVETSRLP